MNIRIFSSKQNTWCYKQGFYQIPPLNKCILSYSKWFQEIKKPLNRIDRQTKIKEFFDQF